MAKQNKKQTETRNTQQEVQQVESVQPAVVEPVQPVVQPAVVEPVQQGGKRKKAQVVSTTSVVEGGNAVQPLAPATATTDATATDAVQPLATTTTATAPATVAVQEGGKRKRQPKQQDTTATSVVAQDSGAESSAEQQVGKRKRTAKPRGQKQAVQADDSTQVQTQDEQVVDSKGRHLRSFKVRLPGTEEYEGRFTGLTPYQAANKALSKYFRLAPADSASSEVTFSICESTRNSRKSVYTYVGARVRLEKPVEYSIDGGRVIVKNFKNSLRKVKKVQQQGGVVAQEA